MHAAYFLSLSIPFLFYSPQHEKDGEDYQGDCFTSDRTTSRIPVYKKTPTKPLEGIRDEDESDFVMEKMEKVWRDFYLDFIAASDNNPNNEAVPPIIGHTIILIDNIVLLPRSHHQHYSIKSNDIHNNTNRIGAPTLKRRQFPRIAVKLEPSGTKIVREREKVVDERVTRRTEEVACPVTGKPQLRTVEYVEKVIETEVHTWRGWWWSLLRGLSLCRRLFIVNEEIPNLHRNFSNHICNTCLLFRLSAPVWHTLFYKASRSPALLSHDKILREGGMNIRAWEGRNKSPGVCTVTFCNHTNRPFISITRNT